MIKEISEALAKIRFNKGDSPTAVVTYEDVQLAHDLMRLVPDLDVDRVYRDGYEEGRGDGYRDGYDYGESVGYDAGHRDGLSEGREQGSDD